MTRTLLYCLFLGVAAMLFTKSGKAQFLNWQFEDVLADERRSGADPDMIADANGGLHLSYWDRLRDRLVYGYRPQSTGAWQFTYIDSSRAGGYRSAIAVDANGAVHLAYYGNLRGAAALRYASNSGGSWDVQDIYTVDSTLGQYGPDISIDTYLELSLDIDFDQEGRPLISFFDGEILNSRICVTQLIPYTFDLNLNIARYIAPDNWEVFPLSYARTASTNCVNPGVNQDRFGEFNRLIPLRSDSSFLIATNSLYNHEMVLFQSEPDSLTRWNATAIDSAERLLLPQLVRVDEGFAFSDAQLTEGNKGRVLHTVYNFCESYGLRVTLGGGRQPVRNFFYTQVKIDSLGLGNYLPYHHEFVLPPRDNHLRTYFSMAAKSEDSLYFAYYDANERVVVLSSSINSGRAWQQDTVLREFSTDSRLKLLYRGDSLFLASYDAADDRLLISTHNVAGGMWRHRYVTPSTSRASFLSAALDSSGIGGPVIHIAYDEKIEDVLHYGVQNGAGWSFEVVDASQEGLRDIEVKLGPQQQPWIAYVWEGPGELRIAHKTGGAWQSERINTGGIPETPSLAIRGDSGYVAYYDRSQQALLLARSELGSGSWQTRVLDNQSPSTGQTPKLVVAPSGKLCVAYKDMTRKLLRYACEDGSGGWAFEDATDSAAYDLASISLQVTRQEDLPVIAFRDALRNMMITAEKKSGGTWEIDTVVSGQVNFVGSPLQLLLDPADNRWLLYNYVTSTEELRLLRRTPEGQSWLPVSVLNNEAQIAGTFAFQQAKDDFYIVGRKNRLDDWGIGMLHAPKGATTDLDDRNLLLPKWGIFPNPANAFVNVQVELEKAGRLSVELMDLQGRRLPVGIEPRECAPGAYTFILPAKDLAPGLYFCRLHVGNSMWVKKLLLRGE